MSNHRPDSSISGPRGDLSTRNMAPSLRRLGSWLQATQKRAQGWGYRQGMPLPEWITPRWKPRPAQDRTAWRGVLKPSICSKNLRFTQRLCIIRCIHGFISHLGERYQVRQQQAQPGFIWFSPARETKEGIQISGDEPSQPVSWPLVEGRWADRQIPAVSQPDQAVTNRLENGDEAQVASIPPKKSALRSGGLHMALRKLGEILVGKGKRVSTPALVSSEPGEAFQRGEDLPAIQRVAPSSRRLPILTGNPTGGELPHKAFGGPALWNASEPCDAVGDLLNEKPTGRGQHQSCNEAALDTKLASGNEPRTEKEAAIAPQMNRGLPWLNWQPGGAAWLPKFWRRKSNQAKSGFPETQTRLETVEEPEKQSSQPNQGEWDENHLARPESLAAAPARSRHLPRSRITHILAKLFINTQRLRTSEGRRWQGKPAVKINAPQSPPLEYRQLPDDLSNRQSLAPSISPDAPPENRDMEMEQPGSLVPVWARTRLSHILKQQIPEAILHRHAKATQITRNMRAEAATAGKHIYFSPQAAPLDQPRGLALLAHELVHVGQPKRATASALQRECEECQAEAVEEIVYAAAQAEHTSQFSMANSELPWRPRRKLPLAQGSAAVRLAAEPETPPLVQLSAPKAPPPVQAAARGEDKDMNVDELAEQVYQRLLWRIMIEREQRGL